MLSYRKDGDDKYNSFYELLLNENICPTDYADYNKQDIAYLLEKKGIALFNKSQAIEICDDKMMTHIVLADHGISMPDTVYAPLCYYKDATISDELINSVEELGYPLVAKKCYGSLGADVNLIKDRTELFNFEQKNKLEAHFYQQFIGRGGEDIRVIVRI